MVSLTPGKSGDAIGVITLEGELLSAVHRIIVKTLMTFLRYNRSKLSHKSLKLVSDRLFIYFFGVPMGNSGEIVNETDQFEDNQKK